MRKLYLSVFAFCAVMYGIAPAHAFNGCSLYEHSYWEGVEFRIGRNYQYAHLYNGYNPYHPDFNDVASSASVPYNCKLELYEHDYYGGKRVTLGPGDYWYFGDRYNDYFSSAKCICGRGKLYELYD